MHVSLLAFGTTVLLLGAQATPEQEARAVIQKAVQALGGEKPVAKLQTMRMKAQGSLEINGLQGTFTLEFTVHSPGRAKMDMEITSGDAKINLTRVRNGARGWEIINGNPVALHPRQPAEVQAWGHLFEVRSLLPLLKDKSYTLSPLGEIKVDGRPAVGVKVTTKGQTDIDLYFDKATMLLVKSARWSVTPTGDEVTLETFYSDYKESDGVKQPMKHRLLHNGKKFIEMEVTEIRLVDQIDAAEFAKP